MEKKEKSLSKKRRNNKKEYIKLALIFVGLFVFFVLVLPQISDKFVSPMIQKFIENLTGNLGQEDTYSILAIVFLFSTFYVFFMFLIANFSKEKKWFKITILTMLFLLVTGFLLIGVIVGNPKLHLNLFENSTIKVGEISCKGTSGSLMEGELIFCDIIDLDIEFTQLNKTVIVTMGDRGRLTRNFTDNHFYAEKGMERIEFYIMGVDQEGKFRNINVGWPFVPLTEDEFERNKEKYLAALIGLFVLIFITVPAGIVNLKKLWNE